MLLLGLMGGVRAGVQRGAPARSPARWPARSGSRGSKRGERLHARTAGNGARACCACKPHLRWEAAVQHRVARHLTQVGGTQLPNLRAGRAGRGRAGRRVKGWGCGPLAPLGAACARAWRRLPRLPDPSALCGCLPSFSHTHACTHKQTTHNALTPRTCAATEYSSTSGSLVRWIWGAGGQVRGSG